MNAGVNRASIELLGQPTPREKVQQRQGPGGKMLDYVDARYVMELLDETVGQENWQREHDIGDGGKVACRIGIKIDGEWVWKADGAGETDIEGDKGSFSDAFKRAAVNWGIARDLYGLNVAPIPARARHQPWPLPLQPGRSRLQVPLRPPSGPRATSRRRRSARSTTSRCATTRRAGTARRRSGRVPRIGARRRRHDA